MFLTNVGEEKNVERMLGDKKEICTLYHIKKFTIST